MIITLDIETIPSFNPTVKQQILANIKPPGQYKKPESISEWMRDNAHSEADIEHRRTSFDGAVGHVCAIGFKFDEEAPHQFSAMPENEKSILQNFFAALDEKCSLLTHRPVFVGHNLVEFDLNFLRKRAIVLNVKPSIHLPIFAKAWDDSVYDTMKRWDAKNNIKLDNLCKALGLEGKGGIDGSMVYDYVMDGRLAEVAEYCKHDVEITYQVYKRMNFL